MSPQSVPLRDDDVDADPIRQFQNWFEQARAAGEPTPDAVALATASADGAPSVRMVLLKGADERGFVFYTNYESRKGRELSENPRAALAFYWSIVGRQVRVTGSVRQTSADESTAYIRTRARGSQLSALASPQSRPIESRETLEQRVAALRDRYGEGELPLPPAWGGFRLTPETIEFWQNRCDRLHDRLLYTRRPDGAWWRQRLAP
jgi:pyridoxamine 5'-phosphate oxidase